MCGICGIVESRSGSVSQELLERMTESLTHRGPEAGGQYLGRSQTLAVGLGFRRLSIVDLSSQANQPLSSEDGAIQVVFNGEIYNYSELKEELLKRGHRFRSATDGETIVHGYEEWGEGVLGHLRGMFTLAVWDSRRGVLFLARDRLGIKPLYYLTRPGRFLFASEVKAILEDPEVGRELDRQSVFDYLSLLATPVPRTFFKKIEKLPPAHLLRYSDQGPEIKRYWKPASSPASAALSFEEAARELLRRLRESVVSHLIGDVEVGVFLSGGLDSSLNTALITEARGAGVKTFSVALQDDPRSDERSWAQRVARTFETEHQEITLTAGDFLSAMPDLIEALDEPVSDPVSVPLLYLSRLARQSGLKVVHVGEGSDELFAGYSGYELALKMKRLVFDPLGYLPGWSRRVAFGLGSYLLSPRRLDYLRQISEEEPFFTAGARGFTEAEKKMFGSGAEQASSSPNLGGEYDEFCSRFPEAGPLDWVLFRELQHRLPELLLMRVDKITMANSLEARVPFLDHRLVELAISLPGNYKIRNGRRKAVLRQAALEILPEWILDRPKQGFCGSASNMVSSQIVEAAGRVIHTSPWITEFIDPTCLERLFDMHETGRVDNGMRIWLLFLLCLWHHRWIEKKEVEALLWPDLDGRVGFNQGA